MLSADLGLNSLHSSKADGSEGMLLHRDVFRTTTRQRDSLSTLSFTTCPSGVGCKHHFSPPAARRRDK
jgi:hypothetical protein